MTQQKNHFCTYCGAKLTPNANFCITCGKSIKTIELLKCPFCSKTMHGIEENGFLNNSLYFKCDSCQTKFVKKEEKYQLLNPKDNTYLIKYKNLKLPWEEWIKIGKGKYTNQEIQEEKELTFKETTDINCPTCNTHFNKFLGEGLLSHYQLICPTCRARYEWTPSSCKFINIPDTKSKLWEHYQEKMSMMGFTLILNKKSLEKSNVYEAKIQTRGKDESYLLSSLLKSTAKVILNEDHLEIKYDSTNDEMNSTKIYYNQINSLKYQINGNPPNIELTVGVDEIMFINNKIELEYLYNNLQETIDKFNSKTDKKSTKEKDDEYNSDADEIMKWYQMMEQGIITKEEFEYKKKEIIGL